MKPIFELANGESAEILALVNTIIKGTTQDGKTYLTLNLKDKSGVIDAKLWNATEKDIETIKVGTVLKINGDITKYRDRLQLKISSYVESLEMDPNHLLPTAPMKKEDIKDELTTIILNDISNPDLQRITRALVKKYDDSFYTFPAASRNHHEFVSGLSYHVLSMLRMAKNICNQYPIINKSLLLAGIVLHDLGKVIELSGPLSTVYTFEGQLIGHISICSNEIALMAQELGIHTEEVVLLQHLVLSHHGKMEFGSPKVPLVLEAEVLSFIDNLDARINMFESIFEKTPNNEFSQKVFSLENRSIYKHSLNEKE